MDCIFCQILSGRLCGHIIYEDSRHVAILDKYPIDKGHSLIIPKKHHETILQMDRQDVGDAFSLAPRIARAIMKATGAVAFSLAQNNGAEARQIVPHVHIHIIPRYRNRGTDWKSRKIPSEQAQLALASQIRRSLA